MEPSSVFPLSRILAMHLLTASGASGNVADIPPMDLTDPRPEWAGAYAASGSIRLGSAIVSGLNVEKLDNAILELKMALEGADRLDTATSIATRVNLASALLLRAVSSPDEGLDDLKIVREQLARAATDWNQSDPPLDKNWTRLKTLMFALNAEMLLNDPTIATPILRFSQGEPVIEFAMALAKRESDPWLWASTRAMRAQFHAMRGETEEAISAEQQALEVWTKKSFPAEWAQIQSSLGGMFAIRSVGSREENLRTALGFYTDALEAWPEDAKTARARDRLGRAVVRMRMKSGEAELRFREAIEDLDTAAELVSPETDPTLFARVQNMLGVAKRQLANGDDADLIAESIEHFGAAIRRLDIRKDPKTYAQTMSNMGNAFRDYPATEANRERFLRRAVEAYESAITASHHAHDERMEAQIQANMQEALRELEAYE